jgi:hypothetical protein
VLCGGFMVSVNFGLLYVRICAPTWRKE